ncbi:MAG: primosomal protein N' [Bacteroidia bacterium]
MAHVAEIILPLAVRSNFSYLLTKEQKALVGTGFRVLVNFGRSKIYTGVVKRVYEELDPAVLKKLKPVLEVLDEGPSLYPLQLDLFKWVAFYYASTEGEVLKAALPMALKPESALRVSMVDDLAYEYLETDDKEFVLLEALSIQPVMEFKEISQVWGGINPRPRLKSMEAKGWVKLFQEVETRYKPKEKSFLRIADAHASESALQVALDALSRAPKQENLLMRIISDFYQKKPSPKTETIKAAKASPAAAKALVEKGYIIEEKVQIDRMALYGYAPSREAVTFTPLQEKAYHEIKASWREHPKKPVLLHGVTGSGKTHVYIKLIREAMEQGKQVLYLLPEIGLTKQIIDRVQGAFGDKVGVYHSRFNDQERVEIWEKVAKKEYQVVVGVRSAVFLPFENLGMIVVDESHDSSYKQWDPAPRYNARDLVVYYGILAKCPVLLGSATPSFESYHNAQENKFTKVSLPERAVATTMPEITLVDMRIAKKKKELHGAFSDQLVKAIGECIERKEQVILLQNRRGYATFLVCGHCGHVPECINCDISLTYHKGKDHARCHYCGYTAYVTAKCPSCEHMALKQAGLGTERVEEQIAKLFPNANVARMDLDTTRGKQAFQQLIGRFESGQIDVLVGTQMVAKGLDVENVTLVGVMDADQPLKFPDFRAHERAYQLLTQVSGRSGRSHKKGRVLIQTHMPDNPILQAIANNESYETVFQREMIARQEVAYPPMLRMIRIVLSHKDRDFIMSQALRIDAIFRPVFGANLLGPDFQLVARVRNVYRMQFYLKISKVYSTKEVREVIKNLIDRYFEQAEKKSLRIVMDVDPG